MLERVADVLREMLPVTPPNIRAGNAADLAALVDIFKVGKRFRALSLPERRDLLDLFTKSAGDLLDRWFESAPIKAAFGFDAVVGNFASPYAEGSAYVLLHHVFGEVNGKRGQWGHARGGMGAITQAMATRVRRARRRAEDQCAGGARRRQGGARGGRGTGGRHGDRRRARRRQREPEAAVRAAGRPAARGCRFPRAHRRVSLRVRHVPDERRVVRTAGFHGASRKERAAASQQRHHHGAVAGLHGARLFRCAHRRMVEGADRRDPDPVDGRRHAGASRHARREPLLPACEPAPRGRAARAHVGRRPRARSPT